MVSWIAARCDGENYGKLLLFKFPKDRLVYGTAANQRTHEPRRRHIQRFYALEPAGKPGGPGQSHHNPACRLQVLYVQPVYLQATVGKMPELKRVIVSLGENLGYGSSFEDALTKLTGRQVPSGSTVRR